MTPGGNGMLLVVTTYDRNFNAIGTMENQDNPVPKYMLM